MHFDTNTLCQILRCHFHIVWGVPSYIRSTSLCQDHLSFSMLYSSFAFRPINKNHNNMMLFPLSFKIKVLRAPTGRSIGCKRDSLFVSNVLLLLPKLNTVLVMVLQSKENANHKSQARHEVRSLSITNYPPLLKSTNTASLETAGASFLFY